MRKYSSLGNEYFAPVNTRMLPEKSFEGKVAFVTGGGTGLGKGMVQMLSSLGAKVAISSRFVQAIRVVSV